MMKRDKHNEMGQDISVFANVVAGKIEKTKKNYIIFFPK